MVKKNDNKNKKSTTFVNSFVILTFISFVSSHVIRSVKMLII